MRLASWLFVKGPESIWVERPYGYSLRTAGPGAVREQHDFADELSLDAFQMALAERLVADGWVLWGVDKDRRRGRPRGGNARSHPDRRAP